MGFGQYHEPPDELPAATRTFARLCASLTEEAETFEDGPTGGAGGGSLGIGSLKGVIR
jgi:hypothetical protein